MIEETKIIIDDAEVAETLNTYFSHAVSSLGITEPTDFISDDVVLNDPIDLFVHKFSNHPSIRIIKAMHESSSFAFAEVSLMEVRDKINSLIQKSLTSQIVLLQNNYRIILLSLVIFCMI